MTPQSWRIYYGDGTTWDSSSGAWRDAPLDNIQVIVIDFGMQSYGGGGPYRCVRIIQGEDIFDPTALGLRQLLGTQKKNGLALPDAQYEAIVARALSDYGIPT